MECSGTSNEVITLQCRVEILSSFIVQLARPRQASSWIQSWQLSGQPWQGRLRWTLKLPEHKFPMEGPFVQDQLLIRKSYVNLLRLAKEYFAQKDGSKQMEGLVSILRGDPGQLVIHVLSVLSRCYDIIPCFLEVPKAFPTLDTLEHSILIVCWRSSIFALFNMLDKAIPSSNNRP